MVAQAGKENQAAVRDSIFLLSYTTQKLLVVFQDTARPSRLANLKRQVSFRLFMGVFVMLLTSGMAMKRQCD